ncbi:MAG TPA: hypothetical protein QGG70_03180 [Candidatus Pacearchaeota archaeon]|nr:hypothetical protein [Candidatus Pacearchaeota archaeon]
MANLTAKKYLKDPLGFIQVVCREYDVDLANGKEYRIKENEILGKNSDWGPILTRDISRNSSYGYTPSLQNGSEYEHSISAGLWLHDSQGNHYPLAEWPNKLTPIEEFLTDRKQFKRKRFDDLHIETGNVSDLGRYVKDLEVSVHYTQYRKEPHDESTAMISVVRGDDGNFELDYLNWCSQEEEKCTFAPCFKDVREATETDFRPYVHRAYEMFSNVPELEWHNPKMYVGEDMTTQDFREVDPLKFMQEIARRLDKELIDEEKHNDSEYVEGHLGYNTFYEGHSRNESTNDGFPKHVLNVELDHTKQFEDEKFMRFLDRKWQKQEFSASNGSTKYFGKSLPDLELAVLHWENGGDGAIDDIGVEILFDRGHPYLKKTYSLENDKITAKDMKRTGFDQIRKVAIEGDFRPYLHRIIEVHFGISKDQWHDPSIYTQHDSNQEQLDTMVNTALETLFTGEERTALEGKLETAKLRMRKGWASVPKLSLGAVSLPSPGQKNVRDDKFVTEAAPLFVEYMSTLGVMTEQEAEELMARKLTNYFIHNGGFQVNRDTAREIVGQLRKEDKQVLEEVA